MNTPPASAGEDIGPLPPDLCPYASVWHPRTLLDWDPKEDPDADFNRSRVPLAKRVRNLKVAANANARPEARLVSLAEFHETSKNPSQGAPTWKYYAFGYWQYVDIVVAFGGSLKEGLILAPNPTIIDAAHRNGVKVYGSIFFPAGSDEDHRQQLRDFVRKKVSGHQVTFPVAHKLVEVARTYGFDGWFVNQETPASRIDRIGADMRAFMAYTRGLAPGQVDVMWYDSMIEDGSISYQNALTDANKMFFQDDGTQVADSMFLNYWWGADHLKGSAALARKLGRSPYDLYAGLELVEKYGDLDQVCPPGKEHRVSVGLYPAQRASMPSLGEIDSMKLEEYYRKESVFWVGPNGDPSDTTGATARTGVARCIPEYSPVCELPFVTSFNTGHGTDFYAQGDKVRVGGWHSLSLQDVLPTYRWIISGDGAGLTPSLAFDDAYHGGTSLLLQGAVEAGEPQLLRLYQAELPVAAGTRITVTAKSEAAHSLHLKAALAFTDDPTRFVLADLGDVTSTDWQTLTADLDIAHQGRAIAQIGLHLSATSATVAHSALRIGQLAVHQEPLTAPAAPTDPSVVSIAAGATDRGKALRLRWKEPAPTAPVHHFEVYRTRPKVFLAATTNTVCHVPELLRHGQETTTALEIVAVGPSGVPSAPATPAPTVTWP
ncbi:MULTISPECIES: endo-beta-N-acetylglucosaminidase [Streptomyces]|uniref:endo-beta-N-acetylglucosaminidase n=1 Tax=Streptomyces TaxID=1883 RepID=UPI00163D2504|nr:MULTISPECIES: glycoside hydrolase [Streptomyces]MBC2876444.1 glycoside hydrolase [Streptomyces sp. TYQ1024]UBI40883.1 hypothetical protein K7I03_33395 [Streptomyces mobaraensis]